jgi:hypothetical protein
MGETPSAPPLVFLLLAMQRLLTSEPRGGLPSTPRVRMPFVAMKVVDPAHLPMLVLLWLHALRLAPSWLE